MPEIFCFVIQLKSEIHEHYHRKNCKEKAVAGSLFVTLDVNF